jgi:hypothetical protein
MHAQIGGEVRLQGRVVDAERGLPIAGVSVESRSGSQRATTDAEGRFSLADLPSSTGIQLRAWRLGYVALDTTLSDTGGAEPVRLALRTRPVALLPLTVRGERPSGGAAAERALFEREVQPGVVGVSGREIRGVPALAEPDVLRALQALPGVVALNDLNAELHVRGGAPDQNLYLLDGARVFAPYHLFGVFGAMNSDAVERVEFFRGALPARYGGALSSVVEIEQQGPAGEGTEFAGGASLLGARLAAKGSLPRGDGRWLIAARRSHVDLIYGDDPPYALYDAQGSVSLGGRTGHRLQASVFASSDRFRMFLAGSNGDLRSQWRNTAGSLRWGWNGGGAWSLAATAWGSGYRSEIVLGDGPAAPPTTGQVNAGGFRMEVSRRGEETGLRAGVDVEGGQVQLAGADEPGTYFVGQVTDQYLLPAAYVEAERWIGRLRLAPGVRIAFDGRSGEPLFQPRLAARMDMGAGVALTAGAGRSYQVLSALRDEHNSVPGPPLWFVHPEGAPASATDQASAAVEGWIGRTWSYSAGAYARTFRNVPNWSPAGSRDLRSLRYDDGGATGLELSGRRHAGRLTGWVGYGLGRARLTDSGTGEEYAAAWDRRHSVDAAAFMRVGSRWSLSGRLVYGSGLPFRPFAGFLATPRLEPLIGATTFEGTVPIFAREQQRYPAYFRLDAGVRRPFQLRGVTLEPYLNVQNLTARPNVLYYRPGVSAGSREAVLTPISAFPLTAMPSLGIDVRF